VGEFIEFLGPGLLGQESCPPWPPDAFAVCASLLRRTGTYVRMLDPKGGSILGMDWPAQAGQVGQLWQEGLEASLKAHPQLLAQSAAPAADAWPGPPLPEALRNWWLEVKSHATVKLTEIAADRNDGLCRALLQLCLVADEASGGIGIGQPSSLFLLLAEIRLTSNQYRSLSWAVSPEKVVVLPKQRTPQRGLTLRSLSNNLALCPAGEVTSNWMIPFSLREDDSLDLMNLLLLPWPLDLSAKEFELVLDGGGLLPIADPYRYFAFRPQVRRRQFRTFLEAALEQAKKFVGRVHAVVLPELALTFQEYLDAEEIALRERALLIAGIACRKGKEPFQAEANACAVQPAGLTLAGLNVSKALLQDKRILQRKHHRWCLDRQQILQYGLGGMMPASKGCWELIEILRRELYFFTIRDWLTVSVLICEDLARQEPASEIVRAVGPNLVIALLMDGPQLRNRWPSHYAGVLADDPGSSVLTLTSLGMSRLSQPRPGEADRSRTIALWRDALRGDQELELPPDDNAAVLSLVSESKEEFTADGRSDGGQTFYPVFGGFHTFEVPADRRSQHKAQSPSSKRAMPAPSSTRSSRHKAQISSPEKGADVGGQRRQ
jgi:hypothetical protein